MSEVEKDNPIIIDDEEFQKLKEIAGMEGAEKLVASMVEGGATVEAFQRFLDESGFQNDPDAEELMNELKKQLAN